MNAPNDVTDPRSTDGFALVLTMLVVMVVGALVTGAAMVGGNHVLANRYYERTNQLDVLAGSGLELARATVNGDPRLYPDSAYTTLEDGVTVTDGNGNTIPGVRRWLYVGPTGVTTGQYGIFGSVVSIVRDDGGGEVIRRSQIVQESFAKFAYFTDQEPNIWFGGGDQIFGPVHSNDRLQMHSTGATFHQEVRTAQYVRYPDNATYMMGYEEYVPVIPMPKTQDLDKVALQAANGGTAFSGAKGIRLEFIAIDLNGDGDTTDDDEGFFKVYDSGDDKWSWGLPQGKTEDSAQCGAWYSGTFVAAADHPYNGNTGLDAVRSATRRCYLGGSDPLNGGFVADDGNGSWVPYTGPAVPGLVGRPDAGYLFPLARRYNPSFRGVISFDDNVAVSGVLRGRVTVTSKKDIVLADDVTYATDPGAGLCQDILGLFAGKNIVVADNLLNAPQEPNNAYDYLTYDDTKDEFFHGVLLALESFTVESYDKGSKDDEACEATAWGRGCLYLTGGIIQKKRGAVGLTSGTGYLKRYSYDGCAAEEPPPYFPTTGHFSRGQYYQVDPTGFSVPAYYEMLTPTS